MPEPAAPIDAVRVGSLFRPVHAETKAGAPPSAGSASGSAKPAASARNSSARASARPENGSARPELPGSARPSALGSARGSARPSSLGSARPSARDSARGYQKAGSDGLPLGPVETCRSDMSTSRLKHNMTLLEATRADLLRRLAAIDEEIGEEKK